LWPFLIEEKTAKNRKNEKKKFSQYWCNYVIIG